MYCVKTCSKSRPRSLISRITDKRYDLSMKKFQINSAVLYFIYLDATNAYPNQYQQIISYEIDHESLESKTLECLQITRHRRDKWSFDCPGIFKIIKHTMTTINFKTNFSVSKFHILILL